MKANEFVKKYGLEKSKSTLISAHHKATHFYCGWMELVDYFYKHENLGWCQVDIRTRGWDSDRCTRGVHPPVGSMISIYDLKRLVESHELVEHAGGLDSAKKQIELKDSEDNCLWCVDLKIAITDVESCHVD